MTPTASVVVPTRNRPDMIEECVRTILSSMNGSSDLLVVDQSDSMETYEALGSLVETGQFRYIRTETRGVAAARNVGIQESTGDVILFTDDDCRVPEIWVDGMVRAIEAADIVYGTVDLPSDLAVGDFAADFHPHSAVYRGKLPSPSDPWGISANMAIRRSAIERIGGFDEALGAGGHFGSGAETDLTIRAVAAGLTLVHTCNPGVLHLGIRHGHDASNLIRRYGFGLGAVAMKHLRLRTRPGWLMLPTWIAQHGVTALRNVLLRKRPSGVGFVLAMVKGAAASLRLSVNRSTNWYQLPASSSSGRDQ